MQHDPARSAETDAWLDHAAADLRAGRHDLSASPPLLEDSLFHAQQAAEKAMKAFLTWLDRRVPRTHDLSLLGSMCASHDASLEALMREAAPLTDYSWRHRYPGPAPEPTHQEAEEALELVDRLITAIRDRVGENAGV